MPLDNLSELKRRVPGGKYTLARAIAERARQLQSGQVIPLVEVRTPNPLSVAIDEIVQGKIDFRFGDDVKTDDEGEAIAASDAMEEVLPIVSDDAPPVKAKKERAPRKTAAAKEAAAAAEAAEAQALGDDASDDEAADESSAESA
ncbi:MAG: DNA-directed RNA polymerase subunit omega [Armatimonadetes bacterium]|nr:DNA-directed RNA polymerase subunit omega [Armatimonadota bacterium]